MARLKPTRPVAFKPHKAFRMADVKGVSPFANSPRLFESYIMGTRTLVWTPHPTPSPALVHTMFNMTRPFGLHAPEPLPGLAIWAKASWSAPLDLIGKLAGLATSLVYAHLFAAYGKYVVAIAVVIFALLTVKMFPNLVRL